MQAHGLTVPGPHTEEVPLKIESLNSTILSIGDVDHSVLVYGNRMRKLELARCGPAASPLPYSGAGGRILDDARIPVTVRHEDPPVRSEGDVRHAADSIITVCRLSTDRNLHQPLSLGAVLDNEGAPRVRSPYVPIGVEPN